MASSFHSFVQSVRHAWRGLRLAFRTERSFRIQFAIALLVILVLFLFPLEAWQRVILLLASVAVLVLELLNSVVERMVDLLKPRLHEYVGDIKDLMAGAVFVASLGAALIGLLILWPYLGEIFSHV